MDLLDLIKEYIVVVSFMGAIFGYFTARFNRLSYEIKTSSERHEARCDKLYEMFVESSERHEARCDKLYDMFIDLLKNQKG